MPAGENRAEYGNKIIKALSKELTGIYGKGFTKSYLCNFIRFYRYFPNIFQSPIGKSKLLTWTHYYLLLNVDDETARLWYAHEAFAETWSVRTLRRNIASQYYYRLRRKNWQENRTPKRDIHGTAGMEDIGGTLISSNIE